MRYRLRRLMGRARQKILERERNITIHPGSRIAWSATIDVSGGGSVIIGAGCDIGEGAILDTHGGTIEIGEGCSLNPYAVLYGHGGLRIGSGVRIAAHATLIPANHGIARHSPIAGQALTKRGIVVGDDVWIGAGARVLDDVTLAVGSVIGAGAVVTRSTEPYSINVGIPARMTGTRPDVAAADRANQYD